MPEGVEKITALILEAAKKARAETSSEREEAFTHPIEWPVSCTVGPGLEGAIACESKVGYVNGSKGWLIYRGYDIFDLCAYSSFEEVSFLLIEGRLPTRSELADLRRTLAHYRNLPRTLRTLMTFPVEEMHSMAALRLGTNLMRQEFTGLDELAGRPEVSEAIGSDEDSIPMETKPTGERHAIYEFKRARSRRKKAGKPRRTRREGGGVDACYHLIAGVATLTAAVARLRKGMMPLDPDPNLSHAGNLLYMMTGSRPDPVQERIMDVSLILHADHGMNASTFAAMVVASTLSDIYLSVGSGVAALSGPLHGGANEEVIRALEEIGGEHNVEAWFARERRKKRRLMGFGHRVYKAYDPRARVLGPLAEYMARDSAEVRPLLRTALALERKVVSTLGVEKKIFPNVDFYSGIVYKCMGIPAELFTPIFAVSRVSGWTARVLEYLDNNRIFRPRAMYVGPFDEKYVPIEERGD